MKCPVCKNNLYVENGTYVCKNCNFSESAHIKRNTDVFICCTEVNVQGSPTIDSMIARDLFIKLKNNKTDVFYSPESLTEYPEPEKKAALESAIDNARIIIITGSTKANFENILNSYGEKFKYKAVLPIYTSMNGADIPRIPEMFPAINYEKTGTPDNICKDVTNILGLLESREATLTPQLHKRKKKKAAIILSAIAVFVLGALISAYILFVAPKLADSKNYDKAQSLSEDGKYIQAINIYHNLGNYKDSVDLMGKIYSRYNGFYHNKDKKMDLDLSIVNKVAKITINEYYGNKVISAKTSGVATNNKIEFKYEDSSKIKGTGVIELFDDYIKLTVKSEETGKYCISTGTTDFSLRLITEPIVHKKVEEITPKLLITWLNNGTTKEKIEKAGYNLEKTGTNYPTGDIASIRYLVEDTDITLEFMVESGYSADETKLFSVTAPASFLSADSVGKKYVPFAKNDMVYCVGEGVTFKEEGFKTSSDSDMETKIRKATSMTLVTKTSYERIFSWDTLLENVILKNIAASIGTEDFTLETTNTEKYLVSYYEDGAFRFYSVDKITYEAKYITKISAKNGEESSELWKNNPQLFPDFAVNKEEAKVLYRVRKSADDAASQLEALENLDSAKAVADKHKSEGYKVYDTSGNLVYTP